METKNLIVQHQVKFTGNTGPFNEQPLFTLVSNKSLSGNAFLNVSRIRKTDVEGSSGVMVVHLGTTAGELYSTTGGHPIYAQSVTTYATTGDSVDYVISTVIVNEERLDLIVNDNNTFFGDITITGFNNKLGALNYLVNGLRQDPEATPTNGNTGSSLALMYTYNREELGGNITTVIDRSNNELSASMHGSMTGDGTSATVTGWTFSPVEGGMRLDGTSWMQSTTSSLLNPLSTSTSAITVMTFAKFAGTGNSNLLSYGSGSTEMYSLKDKAGLLTFYTGASSLSGLQLKPGEWHHIALTMDGTTSNLSGCYLYVDGTSAAYTAVTDYTFVNDAGLVIGRELDLASSSMTGVVGLTKIWNRALSGNEIMQNYYATIPSQITVDSIKIG